MTDTYEHARANARGWYDSIVEMVEALAQADANRDGRGADAITESVLAVEVRDSWRAPGEQDTRSPTEYRILLTTGGPALQLVGTLDVFGEPETAELQMQDWGVPWETWLPNEWPASGKLADAIAHGHKYDETLLTFARCFYFGE